MDMNSERPTTCRDGKGPLPSCGLLAAAFVPVQSAGFFLVDPGIRPQGFIAVEKRQRFRIIHRKDSHPDYPAQTPDTAA